LGAFGGKRCNNWAELIRKNNWASSLIVRAKWKAKILDLEVSHVDDTEYSLRTAFLTEILIHSLNLPKPSGFFTYHHI
jgi:hypothetical protein